MKTVGAMAKVEVKDICLAMSQQQWRAAGNTQCGTYLTTAAAVWFGWLARLPLESLVAREMIEGNNLDVVRAAIASVCWSCSWCCSESCSYFRIERFTHTFAFAFTTTQRERESICANSTILVSNNEQRTTNDERQTACYSFQGQPEFLLQLQQLRLQTKC